MASIHAVEEVPQQIAGNPSVNAEVHRCFDAIGDVTIARRFVRRFDSLRSNNWEVMNVYRELLVGGYLADCGYRVCHEKPLGTRAPDWLVDGPPPTFVEVVTHYLDNQTRLLLERGEVVYVDEEKNIDRIITAVADKATRYSRLADEAGAHLVVAVCLEFSSPISFESIDARLETESSLRAFKSLRAVLLHTHENGRHQFHYTKLDPRRDSLVLQDRSSARSLGV